MRRHNVTPGVGALRAVTVLSRDLAMLADLSRKGHWTQVV